MKNTLAALLLIFSAVLAVAQPPERGIPIHKASFTITSAQLLAMTGNNVNSVQLVPAPGTGLMIVPITAFATFNPGTTPYVSTNDCGYGIFPPGSPANTNSVLAASPTANGWTGTTQASVGGASGYDIFDAAMVLVNQPLVFGMFENNSGACTPVTAGNGTLTISLTYVIVPFP